MAVFPQDANPMANSTTKTLARLYDLTENIVEMNRKNALKSMWLFCTGVSFSQVFPGISRRHACQLTGNKSHY